VPAAPPNASVLAPEHRCELIHQTIAKLRNANIEPGVIMPGWRTAARAS
jgi:hypothetical protein